MGAFEDKATKFCTSCECDKSFREDADLLASAIEYLRAVKEGG